MYRGGVYPSYVHYFSSAVRPVYEKKNLSAVEIL